MDEPRKTNSVLWFGTGTVMAEKGKEEGIALGSLVLGAGLTQSFSFPSLLSYVVLLLSILVIMAVFIFILGRASTFLYPRGQGSEKWEFLDGAKEVELYPPCLIEQIDLAPQAPPLDPSPLAVVSLFLPLIGAALCLSEEDTLHTSHRAAHLHSQVTLALLPHTHSHIHSHTHSLSQTRPGPSMEVRFVCVCVRPIAFTVYDGYHPLCY